MSKTIPLTKGQVALVDDDDYERLMQWKWQAQRDPKTRSFYAVRTSKKTDPGDYDRCARYHIYMHREIMHAQPEQQCDHKNHTGWDNRKANMRLCTHGENCHNREKYKEGSSRHKGNSQHKGVSWHKRDCKWRAYIRYKGHQYSLGYFTDEDEAGLAYNKAALKYFGEFAHLNPIKQKVTT